MTIFIDAIGIVLVSIKAYEAPGTETTSSWVLYLVAGICALAAVGGTGLMSVVYPSYAVVSAIVVLTMQYIGYARLK